MYKTKYNDAYRDKKIESHIQYRDRNREEIRGKQLMYYHENKEAFSKYREDNRHIYREASRRRRARILGNGVEVYTDLQVLEVYGTDCHLCGRPIDLNNSRRVGPAGWETGLHIDHVIPISKGGPDVLDNVRPSHGQCNLNKSARLD